MNGLTLKIILNMKIINVDADFFYKNNKEDFDKLTDKQKYDLALSKKSYFQVWDNIKSFQYALNYDNSVNIENGYVYFLTDI